MSNNEGTDIFTGISLKDAWRNLLTDPSLSDVNLQGTDGVLVHANRCILAARSQVFRNMLYGDFLEAGESVVRLRYDSEILKSVVEFCITDDAEIIRLDICDEKRAGKVVALICAANFFDLPELKCKAESWSLSRMRKEAFLACFFLNEARATFDSSTKRVDQLAWEIILSRPTEALLENDAVAVVSESVLEAILKDKEVQATELTLFQAHVVWTNAKSHQVVQEHEDSRHKKRRCDAKLMVEHIRLERISPSDISTIVEPSGLVTNDQLLQAYKSQALKLAPRASYSFTQMRHVKVWQSSESDVFDCTSSAHGVELLQQDSVIRSGTCKKWKIKLENVGPSSYYSAGMAYVGVASTAHKLSHDIGLWNQAGGWAYGSDGSAFHANINYTSKSSPTPQGYGTGAEITMKLDLRGRGTLEATIAGATFLLFSNMLDAFGEDQEVGVLPAVSLVRPGRVRFMGLFPAD